MELLQGLLGVKVRVVHRGARMNIRILGQVYLIRFAGQVDAAGASPLAQRIAGPVLAVPKRYAVIVKHEVAGARGVWMRTYGAALLGLPDLAVHAAGHHEGQRHFDRLESVLRYVLEAGARLRRGHTMEIGTGEYMRLRAPTLDEGFLVRNGELFVMEMIDAGEINR